MTGGRAAGWQAAGAGALALAAILFGNLDSTRQLLTNALLSGGLPKLVAELVLNPAFQVLITGVAVWLGVKAVRAPVHVTGEVPHGKPQEEADRELAARFNVEANEAITVIRDREATAVKTAEELERAQRLFFRWCGRNEALAETVRARFPTAVSEFIVWGDELRFLSDPDPVRESANRLQEHIRVKVKRLRALASALEGGRAIEPAPVSAQLLGHYKGAVVLRRGDRSAEVPLMNRTSDGKRVRLDWEPRSVVMVQFAATTGNVRVKRYSSDCGDEISVFIEAFEYDREIAETDPFLLRR